MDGLPVDEDKLPPVDGPEGEDAGLVAEIIVSRSEPAECTIYPADASGRSLIDTWISAEEGSFIALEEMW